jgi:hypothetical protein
VNEKKGGKREVKAHDGCSGVLLEMQGTILLGYCADVSAVVATD